jgi:hypothetical protein
MVLGLVRQIKGWLTVQHYHITTIFVITSQAFEGYTCSMGVKVLY